MPDTSDDIVRALADANPAYHADTGMWHGCRLCDASVPTKPEHHDKACIWRRAVEWVNSQQDEKICTECGYWPVLTHCHSCGTTYRSVKGDT